MNKRKLDEMCGLVDCDTLVKLYRKRGIAGKDDHLDGFLVGISRQFVLLHQLEGDTLRLNGYVALRIADLKRYAIDDSFVGRALRLRGGTPSPPSDIVLTDLPALLASVNAQHPLLMIERERKEAGVGFVGRVEKLTRRTLHLKKISAKAEWIETEKFDFKDITRVNFGDEYLEALALVDAQEQQALS